MTLINFGGLDIMPKKLWNDRIDFWSDGVGGHIELQPTRLSNMGFVSWDFAYKVLAGDQRLVGRVNPPWSKQDMWDFAGETCKVWRTLTHTWRAFSRPKGDFFRISQLECEVIENGRKWPGQQELENHYFNYNGIPTSSGSHGCKNTTSI